MQQDYTGLYIMLTGIMIFLGIFTYLGTREDKPKTRTSKHK